MGPKDPDELLAFRGVVGNEAHLEELEVTLKSTAEADSVYQVNFDWNESQGIPGAITIKNLNHSEFFFKTLTLEGVPDNGTIVFIANSWIYPIKYYSHDRIFFTNDTYLLSKMPAPLVPYRQDELEILRGDDNHGPYKAHERVYRYDYYNDLGRENNARPILGGSQDYPYPRRCRTGRPPTTDQNIYIPRDERFGHLKMSDSLHMALKIIDFTPFEFDSFEDILGLYTLDTQKAMYSPQVIRKMPLPHVIKTNVFSKLQDDKYGWRTDEEFARQMLAGMNPVIIRRLTDFPPKSILDRNEYGHHDSKITAADIERNLDNMTVENALRTNRLFILDHHDHFIPFLDRINRLKGNFIYATRTLLFLKDDGALKPLAIELSLPHRDGQQHGAESTVHTPADTGVKGHIWQFAKAYVCVNDSAWHQFVSHWLNTHAVMEPFVIATNRQLSVVHPVHKLLSPHYRQTMNVNADARHTLIMAGGLFEVTQCPGKYGLEMSSAAYKNWNFTEQALPEDLVRRGVAVRDPSSPYGVRLLIKDYPYAVDGLVIWWAIEQWVKEYLEIYYPNDGELIRDKELQEWWKEVREVGHGDLKDQDWWPKMDTVPELARSCATIIWVASALHAAVNFGQYSYAGYMPNRPAFSRRPMPQPGSVEYAQLERGGRQADRVFIRTFTNQFINIVGASLMEILSKHTSDEVYLGQRKDPELWTSDARALEAFKRFGSRLKKIEDRIVKMNRDPALKNRTGPVEMPYMLLYPNTSDVEGRRGEGLTAMGIPNSISI